MVEVNNVSMIFNLYIQKVDNIKEYFVRMVKGTLHYEEFQALKNISFDLEAGGSLGIIGRNGSGKSTLLRLIAGVMKPTSGTVNIYGSVAPLIELGAGFDAELTAKENVYLNGAVLGYSKQQMTEKYDEIVAFSELEDFMDVPVKNFSSGMYARLGFAIATISKPEILIIDEIIAVGDFKFQEKCKIKMEEMLSDGTTLLFVSHSTDQVRQLCEKAVWIDNGVMRMIGKSPDVCKEYEKS